MTGSPARRRFRSALPSVLLLLLGAGGATSTGGIGVAAEGPPDGPFTAARAGDVLAAGPVHHSAAPHDLHMAYGDLAVEGRVVAGRIRMFKDDLERALGPFVQADALSLAPGTEADALVMRYLRDHLEIDVDGESLRPTLLESGQDELDRETVWWVVVQYEAKRAPESLTVRNTLFFELFDDQRNVFKFVRFPEQVQQTYTFTPGEAEHVVRLGAGTLMEVPPDAARNALDARDAPNEPAPRGVSHTNPIAPEPQHRRAW